MEQRKRCPTGTWDLSATVQPSDTLRQRLVTGEHSVVQQLPPTPPALRGLHEALGRLSERLGEQVDQQHSVHGVLDGLVHRSLQTEQAVLRATATHDEHLRAAIAAVQQSDVLHRNSTALLLQTHDRLGAVVDHLETLTRVYRHNAELRQRAASSWVERVKYAFYRYRSDFAAGALAFAVCFVVYSVIKYLNP